MFLKIIWNLLGAIKNSDSVFNFMLLFKTRINLLQSNAKNTKCVVIIKPLIITIHNTLL